MQSIEDIVAAAYRRPLEVSYLTLLEAVPGKQEAALLDRLQAAKDKVESYGLELCVVNGAGDLDGPLLIRPRRSAPDDVSILACDIAKGEAENREFKATFQYDLARLAANPQTPLAEAKSPSVRVATLKTLAAFLNTGGGVLYIGVTDDGQCRGVADDLRILKPAWQNPDGLELTIRDFVKESFQHGGQVNDYVRSTWVRTSEGMDILRLEVTSRRALSFLVDERDRKLFHLFRRQGNRTDEVPIQDVEEFIEYRRKYLHV